MGFRTGLVRQACGWNTTTLLYTLYRYAMIWLLASLSTCIALHTPH